mmetsp:Transcript_23501/g.67734  ORF Transcript_23501/g.67734 Transcript_23501/m.67734 type:complete len:368 (-) Transcript_23501:1733-2836(-)
MGSTTTFPLVAVGAAVAIIIMVIRTKKTHSRPSPRRTPRRHGGGPGRRTAMRRWRTSTWTAAAAGMIRMTTASMAPSTTIPSRRMPCPRASKPIEVAEAAAAVISRMQTTLLMRTTIPPTMTSRTSLPPHRRRSNTADRPGGSRPAGAAMVAAGEPRATTRRPSRPSRPIPATPPAERPRSLPGRPIGPTWRRTTGRDCSPYRTIGRMRTRTRTRTTTHTMSPLVIAWSKTCRGGGSWAGWTARIVRTRMPARMMTMGEAPPHWTIRRPLPSTPVRRKKTRKIRSGTMCRKPHDVPRGKSTTRNLWTISSPRIQPLVVTEAPDMVGAVAITMTRKTTTMSMTASTMTRILLATPRARTRGPAPPRRG